jgi:hypothetical protein
VRESDEEGDLGLACTTVLLTLSRPPSSPLVLPSLSLVAVEGATGRTPTAALILTANSEKSLSSEDEH